MDPLATEKYISLATFRKTGKAVETTIWFAHADGSYFAFSLNNAGKVKRLRNSPRSRIAACDMRGRVHGEWIDAETRLIQDAEAIRKAHKVLRKKYGFQMWFNDLLSQLSGRIHKRTYLEIRLASGASRHSSEDPSRAT